VTDDITTLMPTSDRKRKQTAKLAFTQRTMKWKQNSDWMNIQQWKCDTDLLGRSCNHKAVICYDIEMAMQIISSSHMLDTERICIQCAGGVNTQARLALMHRKYLKLWITVASYISRAQSSPRFDWSTKSKMKIRKHTFEVQTSDERCQ
jgi:hypothetical protein